MVVGAGEPSDQPPPAAESPGVAVLGQTPAGEPAAGEGAGEGATPLDAPSRPERYREDVPIMVASAALAASPFLPWYKMKVFGNSTAYASGWETGTWGPMIAFLGALSLAVAVLRRLRVGVGLPFPDATIHEGAGWLAIVGAVIKFRAAPAAGAFRMSWHWPIFVAVAAAFALAFLAGRMSSTAPFVSIPGWFRGKAGAIGLATIALAVGGAGAFGSINDIDVQQVALGRPPTADGKSPLKAPPNILRGEFPDCAKDFPKPSGAKPREAVTTSDTNPTCVFTFTSTQSPDALLAFYKAELPKAGITFVELEGRTNLGGHALQLLKPKCGAMSMSKQQGAKETTVVVTYGGACPPPPPTASPKK